jgi:hypothetical protein
VLLLLAEAALLRQMVLAPLCLGKLAQVVAKVVLGVAVVMVLMVVVVAPQLGLVVQELFHLL